MSSRLTFRRLSCLARAAVALLGARLRVALSNQAELAALLTQEHRSTCGAEKKSGVCEAWLHDLAWAINGLSRRLPFRTDCLVRVLAAEQILRQRAPFKIHVSAGHSDNRFAAHAWLTCEGVEMTGGEVARLERLQRRNLSRNCPSPKIGTETVGS